MNDEKVITRIAPSPTGNLHIGTARTALFNFLFARRYSGKFIVRIEDTDAKRSSPRFEEDILSGLAWLDLEHDAHFRQSKRGDFYADCIEKLLANDHAFISDEKSQEGSEEIIRLRNPGKEIVFEDLVRGEIRVDTTELGDFVIAKGRKNPLYHLAVVADDADMNITHVIRGEDHISNTPRQILIAEALGFKRPLYAHIPLILASDRSKLSKRKETVGLSDYRTLGYLKEALTNYMVLLGWNPGTKQEFFTLDELIKVFSTDAIQKGGAIFDKNKLNWFNQHYLRELKQENEKQMFELFERFVTADIKKGKYYSKERVHAVLPLVLERVHYLKEVSELEKTGDLEYYFDMPKLDGALLHPPKKKGVLKTRTHLEKVVEMVKKIPQENFTEEEIKDALWAYATEEGRSNVLWPMRVALSGKEKSPGPFELSALFGKEETLERLDAAIKLL